MRSKNFFLCLLVAAFMLTLVREVYAAGPQITAGNGDGSILIKYDDDMTSVASGDKTIAIGQQVTAKGLNSIAIGDNVTANQGIAIGYEGTTATGNRAVAIGKKVIANGDDSIAIGNNVTANKGIAIGYGNTAATSSEAIAIGSYAQANRGIAIGRMAKAENQHSLALGFDATAKENQSTAVGAYTEAQNEKATAIGYYAHAMGENTTALGGMTYAYEADNIAIGTNVEAGSEYSRDKNIVAVGVGLDVEGGESTVVGSNSADYKKYYTRDGVSGFGYDVNLAADYSSAFGHSASIRSGADYAVAIGSNSEATEAYTVSIGSSTTQRRLVNLAAGKADTDAVNVSQLNDLNTLLGGSTLTGGKWGEKFSVDGTEYDSVADAISSLAGGSDNSVLYDGDDKSAVTLGGTNGTKITNLAAGVNASDAVNFGQLSSLGDKIASTLGGDFKFENGALTGGITYGDETTIQGAFNSIRDELDKLSEGWTFNPVDDSQQSGGEGTGDGAGTPPASSTIKPGDSLTVNAGDDINITQNGDKDYTISVDPALREEIEEGYTAADSALKTEITEAYQQADSALKTEITEAYQQADSELKTEITEAYQQADSELKTEITEAYQQADSALKADIDKNSETIGEIGSVLGGAENGYKKPTFDTVTANDINVGKVNISSSGINMGGADIATGGGNIDMGGGRITNVAGGAIAQGSTDAVNGGQLWDAYQRMDAMGGDIYRRMDDLREDVNIVGAHAAALSGLHPIDYNPYEPTTLSAAIGTYRDEYAVAVGVFHYAKENVMFNLGASLCSDGDIMGRAGVSFTVGKSSDKPKVAGTMNGLRNQVIAMQAKLDELEAEKKKDKETIRRNEETLRKNEEIMKQNAELIRELTKKLEAKR